MVLFVLGDLVVYSRVNRVVVCVVSDEEVPVFGVDYRYKQYLRV